jgi:hypothetical protein
MNDDNSYLVDVDGFSKADRSLAKVSYFYEDAEFPTFGPKAVEQTRHLMRYVFEHQDEAKIKAAKLTQKVLAEYNWNTCVRQMCEKLKLTYDALSLKKDE